MPHAQLLNVVMFMSVTVTNSTISKVHIKNNYNFIFKYKSVFKGLIKKEEEACLNHLLVCP